MLIENDVFFFGETRFVVADVFNKQINLVLLILHRN